MRSFMIHYYCSAELCRNTFVFAGVLELADEVDSKSIDGNIVRVQVPPPAFFLLFLSFFFTIRAKNVMIKITNLLFFSVNVREDCLCS